MSAETEAPKSRPAAKATAISRLLARPATARSLKLGAVAIALVCLALYALNAWAQNPVLLLLGRDGRLANWLLHQSVIWNTPFSITTLNPFQGMGSMMLPVNAWWIPGSWPLILTGSLGQTLTSEFVYASELFLATLVLAKALRLDLISGIVAATACLLLLFPPFNFTFGLQGWISTAPIYGHTLALVALAYALIARLGAGRSATAANLMLVVLFLVIVFLLIAAAPFWNAGMLVGTGIGLTCIGLSSVNLRTFLWRVGAGVALIAAALASGLVSFLISAFGSSVRFTGSTATNTYINWHVLVDPPPLSQALDGFCASGIACATPNVVVSTYYIHGFILIGASLLAIFGFTKGSRRLGAIVGLMWIGLFVYWYFVMIGLLASLPLAPVYIYLPFYPLLAVVAVGGFSLLVNWIAMTISPQAPWLSPAFYLTVLTAVVFWLATSARLPVAPQAGEQTKPADAVLAMLEEELSISPDAPFGGSVASAFGVPGGSLSRYFDLKPGQKEPPAQFERYLSFVEEKLGSSLALLDLWERDIPSVEEYGQAITLALKRYQHAFFSSGFEAGDYFATHFVLMRKLNAPIMESMGVRFVITDGKLGTDVARLRESLTLDHDVRLNVYELPNPNTGDWSIIELRAADSAEAVISALVEESDMIRRVAFVEKPADISLVPASAAELRFVHGGAKFKGHSDKTSAVLLPLQYSHCLRPVAMGTGHLISVQRANVLHTLVTFTGEIEVRLEWDYGLTSTQCRKSDTMDIASSKEATK